MDSEASLAVEGANPARPFAVQGKADAIRSDGHERSQPEIPIGLSFGGDGRARVSDIA